MDNTPTPHPHSKLWLGITAGVIVITAIVSWYFVFQTRSVTDSPAKVTTSPTSQPASSQAESAASTPTPTINPSDTSTKTVAKDIKSIDTAELKSAVKELKAAVAQFQ